MKKEKADKFKEIIEKSGDDFHQEVADILASTGWNVQKSPYFTDLATSKAREIDIVARKEFQISDRFWGRRKEKLLLRLFIECKYIKDSFVLWTSQKDMSKAKTLILDNPAMRHSETPLAVGDQNQLGSGPVHHYLVPNTVVKGHKSSSNRDDLYDAWVQALHAMIYFQRNQREGTPYVVDFPIVAVNSYDNFRMREGLRGLTEYFQLELDYSYPDKNGVVNKSFLVDVVALQQLKAFLETMEKNDRIIFQEELSDRFGREEFERSRQQPPRHNEWM